jgi:RHS repeat-associated protein
MLTAGLLQLTPDSTSGLVTSTSLNNCVNDATSYVHTGQTLSFGEISTYSANTSASCGSVALASITYDTATNSRDKLGRVVQKQETINGTPHTFAYTYDTANRLSTVTRDGTQVESYTYDANGNRLTAPDALNPSSQTMGSATYDAQDRLTTYPQPAPAGTNNYRTYVYSLAGERTQKHVHSDWLNHSGGPIYSDSITQYTYDAFGNLLTVILPTNNRIDYVVDGENRRVGKLVNGALVQGFLYGSEVGPIAELNPDGSIKTRFVYATRSNVPDYMVQVQSGTLFRIITDQLGSVRLVVNATTGAVVQQLDYDSFGNVISATPAYPTLVAAVQPFGFAGGLYDADTTLVRFGARDYDPEVGRWLSKDPLRFGARDANLYAYAANDPINHADPTGLDWAIGVSLTFSAINPMHGSGGGEIGINIEYVSGQGWSVFAIHTGNDDDSGAHHDAESHGFLFGGSCSVNVGMTGNTSDPNLHPSWSGPFDEVNGSFGPASFGTFESPGWSQGADGWGGVSIGAGIGPPGVGRTTATYTELR